MKIEKTQEIGDGKRQERSWGCWKDKQHRRKKLQVRHLVFPEAILKQDSAGVSLYDKRGNRKKKTREKVRNREIPQLEQLRQPKLKATHSKTADVHLDVQPRHPPTQPPFHPKRWPFLLPSSVSFNFQLEPNPNIYFQSSPSGCRPVEIIWSRWIHLDKDFCSLLLAQLWNMHPQGTPKSR